VTEDENYSGANLARIGWKMPEEDKKDIQLKL
jgi:hypothetical protein